ncbi:YjbH domain-containing protein [Leisingera daeponensis]|uniref:YjbH domain-containing protein n=1 Tax=Leisingera daeponensis TaxID=405746 RepID=A0ABS7NIH7_9RHOB|nr:YjbH domain-containing protein [Leisingera daeponensis]MBY6141012.1 YjbH domain-containing protein [Leisingera daeponensis]
MTPIKTLLRRTGAIGGAVRAAAALLCLTAAPGQAERPEITRDDPQAAPGTEAAAPRLKPLPPPSLNFYGSPGIIDMPSAEMLPDGQYAVSYSWFAGQSRYNITFQALPWLSASFRYNGIKSNGALIAGFQTYYDRGFDVRARLWRERRWLPEVTMGLQDFAGTGIYAAEYFVATKRFEAAALGWGRGPGRLKVSAGLGWGRLGSHGAIGSIGSRPSFVAGDTGGELATDQWFRGDVAPFAGFEWQPDERWSLKAEYSTDAYALETGAPDVFERKSSLNFGMEYQYSDRVRLGAYYLYGSEIGLTAQIQLNPKHPPAPMAVPAPPPVIPRSQWATEEAHWRQDWAASEAASRTVRDRAAEALKADGLVLEAVTLTGTSAELRYRNIRYRSQSQAAGRAARALAQTMPPSVETFRLVPVHRGTGLSAIEIRRSDLEALEFDPDAADALMASAGVQDAGALPPEALFSGGLYPAFATSVSPYTQPAYFDPEKPFRIDAGIDFAASYAPAPGWRIAGTIRQRLAGNVKNGRASNSVLPHVRTDQSEYAQFGTTLENLYVSRLWKPGRNLYARATAGLFEAMYGGVSGELLWKPVNSRIGFGLEANYVVQRDFDQRFSFRDYKTFTGHASAYAELGKGYLLQVDAGRYLAGDYGGTVSLNREFGNGFLVGAFFTLTDVSAEDFGEGSFDKGFVFRIPVDWLLGKPSRSGFGLTIRPTQRDGGQRVAVPDRLYGPVREAHRKSLEDQRARFWE